MDDHRTYTLFPLTIMEFTKAALNARVCYVLSSKPPELPRPDIKIIELKTTTIVGFFDFVLNQKLLDS